MKQRQRLIEQSAKEVYKKAIRNTRHSTWKQNYILFVQKIIQQNGNIWIKIDKNKNIMVAKRYLEWRHYINPRYKLDWFLSPASVALSKHIISNIPHCDMVNKVDWTFTRKLLDKDVDNVINDINKYIESYIETHPYVYIYRLTPDMIWFIHNIIRTLYLNWDIFYESKLKK